MFEFELLTNCLCASTKFTFEPLLQELTQRQQTPLHQEDENEQIGAAMNPTVKVPSVKSTISFNIERAMLYPPEVEKGIWPEGYSLSDHALLSVEFRPVNINVPTYD